VLISLSGAIAGRGPDMTGLPQGSSMVPRSAEQPHQSSCRRLGSPPARADGRHRIRRGVAKVVSGPGCASG